MIHCVLVWFLKPVPLSEMVVPLTNSLKHAAACRSMPQRAKIFLGTVGAWAPPHIEEKGPREGQRMAIGQ